MSRFGILIVLLFLVVFGCDNSVTIEPNYDSYFVKYFGSEGNQTAVDLIEVSDGFVLLGNSNRTGDRTEIFVVKTDPIGNELWSRVFGSSKDEFAASIIQNPAGGYVVVANVIEIGANDEIKIYMLDDNGNEVDSKEYKSPDFSASASQVVSHSDGGFIIVGNTDEVNPDIDCLNCMLVLRTLPGTIDTLTNNSWTRIHGEDDENIGVSAVENNGFVYVLGSSSTNNASTDGLNFLFFELAESSVGTGLRFLPGTDDDQFAKKLIIGKGGGFVLMGNTVKSGGNSDLFIKKTVSTAPIEITRGNLIGVDIVDTGLGFLVLGTKIISIDDSNIYLTFMDTGGNQEWERTFGGVNLDSGASGLTVLQDGSIVFAGTIELGNQTKMALFKTNSGGDLEP